MLFGASGATSLLPGASTSGFVKPSCVTPRLDHDATTSSSSIDVPLSSSAPAVITNGSLPGAKDTEFDEEPSLPAAAATTMPENQAASAAASSGSVL